MARTHHLAAGAAIGAAAALGVLGLAPAQADDISTYPGTKCAADQFYDATTDSCATDAVTNDPNAAIQPEGPGESDPGIECKETEYYSVGGQACTPDVVTNDPQDVPAPEGEDPTQYSVPTAGPVDGCAGDRLAFGACT